MRDHEWVKDALTVTVAMFWRMGLETNMEKSKQWCVTPDESGRRWGIWTIKYGRQETGDRLRGNLQIAEEGKGELRHMRRDGAGVLS